ncbi:MAG: FAD-dependent monooxygenase [Microlunatus sp.]
MRATEDGGSGVEVVSRDCVIAGGGPAGLMAGYLLARRGLQVTVLEKHADFLRDFRGDTIHPSTISLLGELGLRERFLELPVTRLSTLDAVVDGQRLTMVDFSTLPPPDDFLVLAPQWHFLDFLAREARHYPGFELRMCTEATEVVTDGDRVVGVRGSVLDGELEREVEFRAPLTVAADGRSSRIRRDAGLTPVELGVAIDVLWFSLPKPPDPPPSTLGYLDGRDMVLTIDRGDCYQGAWSFPKVASTPFVLPGSRRSAAG